MKTRKKQLKLIILTNHEIPQSPSVDSSSSSMSSVPSPKKQFRNAPFLSNPWTKEELIPLLHFINDNIDDWIVHPKILCKKAIELNLINQRSAHAIYQKVHNIICAMKAWLMEKKRGYETLIWNEEKVNELLEEITKKIIEKENEKNETVDVKSEQEEEDPPTKKSANNKWKNKKMRKSKRKEAIENMIIDDIDDTDVFLQADPPCLPFSIPMLSEMYKLKLQEIENMDTGELKDLATEALNKEYKEVLGMVHDVYREHGELARLVHKTESKIQELKNEDWFRNLIERN